MSQALSQCIPAVQYVRMSTEHQQYSTANQMDALAEYADRRGFAIVRTYADEGKSGLSVTGREALSRLLADVQGGNPGFKAILVYDVSRWGRFQDADESAYYEYLCKQAGIEVHYAAEQFENDGKPTSTIIKSIKRAMAAEYSRELSTRVFRGQCRLIKLGYRQGGLAGYGLRRMLISPAGVQKGILAPGEWKSLLTDRVILVPGPDEEVRVVRRIFCEFTQLRKPEARIAATLNAEGICGEAGRPWTRMTIHEVLTNEKYIGNNVRNRSSRKLMKGWSRNSPDKWVRAVGAFEGIVAGEAFYAAQKIIRARTQYLSDDQMLERLKNLVNCHRFLSCRLINSAVGMPHSDAYRNRFGSLRRAYQLVGYEPERNFSRWDITRNLRDIRRELISDVVRQLEAVGALVVQRDSSDLLVINGEFRATFALCRCRRTRAGSLRWDITIDNGSAPDIAIIARMNASNERPADYYLLPVIEIASPRLLLRETNQPYLDMYQFDNLHFLAELATRRKIEVST